MYKGVYTYCIGDTQYGAKYSHEFWRVTTFQILQHEQQINIPKFTDSVLNT